ncbi:hypothetical protein TSUD_243230 [Trifolium subterraneum]|uniref:Uncharacterized protein n=1 Tax=Trifolium subterraneum TaxID=3900 RepID=A0A2Z6P965_TRISU|nr:hypothetical protein TSUD_243230 [Trifolium subterraneum]
MGPTTEIELGITHTCVAEWHEEKNKASTTIKTIDYDDPYMFVRVSSSNIVVNNMTSSNCQRIEGSEEHWIKEGENVIGEKSTEMSMAKPVETSAQSKMAMATPRPTETMALIVVGSSPIDFIKNIILSTCKKLKCTEGKIKDSNSVQTNDNLQQDKDVRCSTSTTSKVNDCRNTSKKTTENDLKKTTIEEASTSISRRRRVEVASSSVGFIKNIISSTCERTDGFEGKIEDTNAAQPNDNLQQDQDVPELYRFMGLFICKERNGVRSLGTVFNYYLERNLLKV